MLAELSDGGRPTGGATGRVWGAGRRGRRGGSAEGHRTEGPERLSLGCRRLRAERHPKYFKVHLVR